MGRYGIDDPRRNLITFKVSDHELLLLNMLSDLYGNRSAMIRAVVFDFALQIDPVRVREHWDEVKFDGLKKKVREE